MTRIASENIILQPISVLLPGQTFAKLQNLVSFSMSLNATGGAFSFATLRNSAQLPLENMVLTFPFNRFGTVKSTGSGFSGGGMLDTVGGPLVPFVATQQTYLGVPGNVLRTASSIAAQLASGMPVFWGTLDGLVRNFIFRGIMLSGIQQLASLFLADVFVRDSGIYVVDPGTIIGTSPYTVPPSDIISASQAVDFSLDIASVLNPVLLLTQGGLPAMPVYDSQHAQKQPKFTVQCGAPGSQGSSDFVPIPDGWLVSGTFEEWTPPSGTDFTNPSPSVPNGRYWKVFPSPTSPGLLRGITSFDRLIKQTSVPGNSNFVGSPVTGATRQGTGREFNFSAPGNQNGIYGFDSTSGATFFDVISNQFYTFANAIVLEPGSATIDPSSSFFGITMEIWTFPPVNPQSFPAGGGPDPTNPFNIPQHVQVVNPSSNVTALSVSGLLTYYNRYLANFQRINSPRLRTTISTVYRGFLPQPGDQLIVASGLPVNNCGRISTVSLNYSRGGLVLNVTAERYQYSTGS